MGYNPLSVNPDDQAFLDEVERITSQFVPMLEEMKVNNPDACMGYAAKAVDVLLTQKPAKEKTAGDWYLTVAEYQISFLLPYLSCNELKNTREKLLKRTPKRLMFPKQLELIRLIDKLLKP
jgi:hypothetical protein